jgi:hypothetical protein
MLLPIFGFPHKNEEKKYSKEIQEIIGEKNAGMPKNGQKLVKEVQKCKRLKFDSVSFTDESPVDKDNSIFEKNIFKIRCLWTQLDFILGLIEFREGLVTRKIDF